jgi:hypothetical protein
MAEKYSLIIGIENYPPSSGQPKVSYASKDALEMADYARQAGFHLINDKPLLDKEASYGQVMSQLKLLFYYAKPEDFIFLYYSGHGYFSEDGGYLIPFNYPKEHDIDEHCCISFDSINKRFKNKKTRRFLFFLDTCHSGFAVNQLDIRSVLSTNISFSLETQRKIESQLEDMLQRNELSQNIGRVIFTSSSTTEYSRSIHEFKHGLFTYYLLSALKAENGEKVINVEALIQRVKENVLNYCLTHRLEQTPNAYTNIQGEFVIPTYETKSKNKEIALSTDFPGSLEKTREGVKLRYPGASEHVKIETIKEDRSEPKDNPIQVINKQAKFDAIKRMPESTVEELVNKIESMQNLKKEHPGIWKEEDDNELIRLTSILEIQNIWQLEERNLPELSTKLNLLERVDKKKYSLVNYNIPEKIAFTKNKIEALKFEAWNRRYNNYNRISIIAYIVVNSLLSFFLIRNYFIKGGITNLLGIGLLGAAAAIFLTMAGKWGLKNVKYAKRDRKISHLISLEFAKLFFTSSLTCAAYLNFLASPDTFFTGSNFLFPLAVMLNLRSFLELMAVKPETPYETKKESAS